MTKVYLSTGSNIGDRLAYLQRAVKMLEAYPGISVSQVSAVYETAPWGYPNQALFLNQIVEIETQISPADLLSAIKKIEKEIGRTPSFKYGPRVIDMDILFYGDQIIEQENLTIPHPHLSERAFVLVPLADLIPDFVHPKLGKTVAQLKQAIDCSSVVWYADAGEIYDRTQDTTRMG